MKKEILEQKRELFKKIFPEYSTTDTDSLLGTALYEYKMTVKFHSLFSVSKNSLHKIGQPYSVPCITKRYFMLTKTGKFLYLNAISGKKSYWKEATLKNLLTLPPASNKKYTETLNKFNENLSQAKEDLKILIQSCSTDLDIMNLKKSYPKYFYYTPQTYNPKTGLGLSRSQLIKLALIGKKYQWIEPYKNLYPYKFFKSFASLDELKSSLGMNHLTDDQFDNILRNDNLNDIETHFIFMHRTPGAPVEAVKMFQALSEDTKTVHHLLDGLPF